MMKTPYPFFILVLGENADHFDQHETISHLDCQSDGRIFESNSLRCTHGRLMLSLFGVSILSMQL